MGLNKISAMLIFLRLVHVLIGAIWVGSVFFTAAFLIPTVRALGPGGGPVMQQIGGVRKYPAFALGAGVLTVLSGIGLYWRASGGFTNREWLGSGTGITFGIGAVLALSSLAVGATMIAPTAKRASALGATIAAGGKPPSPEQAAEMGRLQERLAKLGALGAVMLLLTTAAMAVARYIP
jgi:hypothetical protein